MNGQLQSVFKRIAQSAKGSQTVREPSKYRHSHFHSRPTELSLIGMREEKPSDHQDCDIDYNKDYNRDFDQVQGDLLLVLIKRQLNTIEMRKFMEKMKAL